MGTTHRTQCASCGYAAETADQPQSSCPICPICGQSLASGWLHVLAMAVTQQRWIACYDPRTNTVTTFAPGDDAVQPQES